MKSRYPLAQWSDRHRLRLERGQTVGGRRCAHVEGGDKLWKRSCDTFVAAQNLDACPKNIALRLARGAMNSIDWRSTILRWRGGVQLWGVGRGCRSGASTAGMKGTERPARPFGSQAAYAEIRRLERSRGAGKVGAGRIRAWRSVVGCTSSGPSASRSTRAVA
jgi:hypothetical protein